MKKKFSEEQLAELRKFYASLERIDPCSEIWANLNKFVEALPDHLLAQLVEAEIKWLSRVAALVAGERRKRAFSTPFNPAK